MREKLPFLMQEAEAESTTSGSTPSSPTPAAEKPAVAPAPDAGGEESPVDWNTEIGEVDAEAGETAPATKPVEKSTAAPEKPAAPVKPAEAEKPPASATKEPEKPVPVAEKPAPAVPAKEPEKPVPVAETPEAKAAREAASKAEEEKLFQGLVDYYKLPEDMAARLPTEPEMVLPHLAAKVHQAITKSVEQMLVQQLPQYIRATQLVQEANERSKAAFFSEWPQLVQYEQQVLQAAQLFRQLNPTATSEQAIKAVGEIVSKSLNITVATSPAVQPAAVAAPFAPAGGAGSGRAPAPKDEENIFTQLAMEE